MITKYKIVKLDYTVRDDSGKIIDTTIDDEPLEYMQGADQIIDGLEAVLEGMQVSQRFSIRVEPENAYGFLNEDLIHTVNIEAFNDLPHEDIVPGMLFDASTKYGELEVRVTDVDGEEVTVDANHPLAGLTLIFDGVVLDVRDASPEEIEIALAETQ